MAIRAWRGAELAEPPRAVAKKRRREVEVFSGMGRKSDLRRLPLKNTPLFSTCWGQHGLLLSVKDENFPRLLGVLRGELLFAWLSMKLLACKMRSHLFTCSPNWGKLHIRMSTLWGCLHYFRSSWTFYSLGLDQFSGEQKVHGLLIAPSTRSEARVLHMLHQYIILILGGVLSHQRISQASGGAADV